MSTLFVIKALEKGFIGILLTLDTIIYGLIGSAFRIFMALAGARLLSSEVYYEIANKIYVVVGVLTLFILAYAILKAIIDPDQASKGEFGQKMIKNVVVAILGLALAPALFNLMYQAQGLILEQDVLGKLFFRMENTPKVDTGGGSNVGDGSVTYDSQINPDEYVKSIGGAVTATSLWQAFFHVAEDSDKDASEIEADPSDYFIAGAGYSLACAAGVVGSYFAAGIPVLNVLVWGATAVTCMGAYSSISGGVEASEITNGDKVTLAQAYAYTSAGKSFGIYTVFVNNYIDDGDISYLFGISTIAGAFALYAFISFSLDMGIRAAKLAYLQIIAPVPIVLQIMPKFKSNFDAYIKSVTSTFIEVFVRISVVYIVVYIICHLTDLFSSVGALWGNSGLGPVEQMLALAFLILGLIAFSREAPKFITDALHLPSGNMKLGISKKLAAGGAYSAGSVAYGGATSAVRNWNANSGKGLGKQFGSAIAGMGSGMWRAAHENFIGPNHKEAQTWADLKNVGERAAQGAEDARVKRDDRVASHEDAVRTRDAAKSAFETAEAAYNSARPTDANYDAVKKAYEKALKEYEDAVVRANQTSAIGAIAENLGDRAKAWSVGTVSTEKEEAAMKFGSDLDGLKGKLREDAYKKDSKNAKRLYDLYNAKKNATISEYADGWDEGSANAEYRKRNALLVSDPNYQTRLNDLNSKRDALKRLSNTDPGYSAALADFNAAKSDLRSTLSSHGLSDSLVTDDGNFDLISDLRVDVAKATRKRTQELEAIRLSMEAAADAWVHEQAMDVSSGTHKDIATFLSEHAVYSSQNASAQITVGYELDSSGKPDYSKPIKDSLKNVMEEAFGSGALQGKFIPNEPNSTFKDQNGINVKLSAKIQQGGHDYDTVTYKLEGDKYVPYVVDEHGNVGGKVSSSVLREETKADFFDSLVQKITEGKVSKASSDTAVSRASDKGKTSATYVRNNDYAEKIWRKRSQDSKNGGKK